MFDKVNTHLDDYRGPATGSGTEHGDTWPAAIRKINAGFENIIKWIEGFDPDATAKVTDKPLSAEEIGNIVQGAMQPLQDQINALSSWAFMLGADTVTEAIFTAMPEAGTLPTDQQMPPPNDGNSLDPNGQPATGADPVPQA